MTQLERIVIVGNGIAGVTAADTLRELGFVGDLTIVGDELHPAYSRPALSKALLRDEQGDDGHLLPAPGHGATEIRGRRATGVDLFDRLVRLDDRTDLPFDGLVIATGCRPRRLAWGPEAPDEVTLRTVEDARELRARLTACPTVIVIGGGPLGMEIASACRDAGCSVTVVTQGPPLAVQLGAHLSEILTQAALDLGVTVVSTELARPERAGTGTQVRLAEGPVLSADLVITAAGDIPNVEWLADSGLLRDGRLLTDASGVVAPGIVAAGDVATQDTGHGLRRTPLWMSAIEQGRAAARALLGQMAANADPRPYFWTEQFGLSVKAVGHLPLKGAPVLVDGDPEQRRMLLHWPDAPDGGAAVSVNYRIPVPRLRALGRA